MYRYIGPNPALVRPQNTRGTKTATFTPSAQVPPSATASGHSHRRRILHRRSKWRTRSLLLRLFYFSAVSSLSFTLVFVLAKVVLIWAYISFSFFKRHRISGEQFQCRKFFQRHSRKYWTNSGFFSSSGRRRGLRVVGSRSTGRYSGVSEVSENESQPSSYAWPDNNKVKLINSNPLVFLHASNI